MAEGFDLVIFHQFVPAKPPRANALYVFPPDSPAFRVLGEARNVEILDWDAQHPVLNSVSPLSSLPLRRARIVGLPSWSRALLWSRTSRGEFPLAFAGELDGQRTAFIGFDLAGERLLANDNLDLFLFFMNLLGWLLPGNQEAAVVPTGSVWAWPSPAGGALVVRGPGGETTLPEGAETIELLHAGAYTVQSGNTRRSVFANFFVPAESDIGRAARPPVTDEVRPSAGFQLEEHPAGRRPLYTWFYVFAAAFFLVEWVVAWRMR